MGGRGCRPQRAWPTSIDCAALGQDPDCRRSSLRNSCIIYLSFVQVTDDEPDPFRVTMASTPKKRTRLAPIDLVDTSMLSTTAGGDEPDDPSWRAATASSTFDSSVGDGACRGDGACVIVSVERLHDLLRGCLVCGGTMAVAGGHERFHGAALVYTLRCPRGHDRVWASSGSHGSLFMANLKIVTAILTTGGSISSMVEWAATMNLRFPSSSSLHELQSALVLPAIERVFERHQAEVVREMKAAMEPLVLAADGRSDSPGSCAKYTQVRMGLDSVGSTRFPQ